MIRLLLLQYRQTKYFEGKTDDFHGTLQKLMHYEVAMVMNELGGEHFKTLVTIFSFTVKSYPITRKSIVSSIMMGP